MDPGVNPKIAPMIAVQFSYKMLIFVDTENGFPILAVVFVPTFI